MTTEYIGEAFRPIFNAAMAAWWAGNCEGVCPMENWEMKGPRDLEIDWTPGTKKPAYKAHVVYRFKPAPKRTVTIGYRDLDGGNEYFKTLVAPQTVAPSIGTIYFYQSSSNSPIEFCWHSYDIDKLRLSTNLVFLTREDAQAMADWTAKCRRGGA